MSTLNNVYVTSNNVYGLRYHYRKLSPQIVQIVKGMGAISDTA